MRLLEWLLWLPIYILQVRANAKAVKRREKGQCISCGERPPEGRTLYGVSPEEVFGQCVVCVRTRMDFERDPDAVGMLAAINMAFLIGALEAVRECEKGGERNEQ